MTLYQWGSFTLSNLSNTVPVWFLTFKGYNWQDELKYWCSCLSNVGKQRCSNGRNKSVRFPLFCKIIKSVSLPLASVTKAMISTTFGWHLPRSHSEIAPDNTIFISRTTNRFQFSPLESIIKQRRSVTEDPRHFRKARHIPNLEQMTIEVALGRVELKRKRKKAEIAA